MIPIKILTGPTKTGKTTRLMQWSANKKNIDGIFQPVIEGKRFIYHISSRSLKMLESDSEKNSIKIGNYNFSRETFKWSQNILLNCFEQKLEWLIIDEIGPLELNGNGLEPVITSIINRLDNFEGNILFVVRETILEKFINKYELENKFQLFSFDN